MAAAVKLDEDLSPIVGEPLEHAGHDVATVVGQGWGGMKDPAIWQELQREGRLFITADKGFGDIRAYPPGTHAGVVLLRPLRESIKDYREMVEKLLARYDPAALAGALTVVSPRSIRIRRFAR